MRRHIRLLSLLVACAAILGSSGVAEAHVLKNDNGYSAVLHIDPDDEPLAAEPTVLNFLIDRAGGGFKQNDYKIGLDVLADGKLLQHAVVKPAGFGNAGDGVVRYTFPGINVYTIDLRGTSLTDSSAKFHMSFIVRVADTAGTGSNTSTQNRGSSSDVLLLSFGSLMLVVLIGFTVIRQGKRYQT